MLTLFNYIVKYSMDLNRSDGFLSVVCTLDALIYTFISTCWSFDDWPIYVHILLQVVKSIYIISNFIFTVCKKFRKGQSWNKFSLLQYTYIGIYQLIFLHLFATSKYI